MKSCWQILNIEPTKDKSVIRKCYIGLIKKYHPDLVTTPEKKRKYTIRAAQINCAYKEALKFAQELSNVSTSTVADNIIVSQTSVSNVIAVFACLILFFLISILIALGTPVITALPDTNPFRVVFMSIIVFAVALSIVGLCFMGIVDILFIFLLFPRKLLTKIGLQKFEHKLIWCGSIILNFSIMYLTALGDSLSSRNDAMNDWYNEVWRFVGAGTIPIWFAIDWLRDLIVWRKFKNEILVVVH